MSRHQLARSRPTRSRRVDAETAELARRRLEVVLRPRRALPARTEPVGAEDRGDDPELDRDLGLDDRLDLGLDDRLDLGLDDRLDLGLDLELDDRLDPGHGHPPVSRGDRDAGTRSRSGGVVGRAKTFTRGHLGVVLALAVVALLIAAAGVARARPLTIAEPDLPPVTVGGAPMTPSTGSPAAPPSGTGTPPAATPSGGLVVHVLGAVRHAGVVRLPAGARVGEAIQAAGGLARDADPGELNLAQPLLDGQQVVVVTTAAGRRDPPERSEVRDAGAGAGNGGPTASGAPTGSRGSGAGGLVNLNTATAEQLDGLSGVGPVTAQRILDWRAEHGRFSRIEELQEVDGIGPKTFAELAPQVTV